MMTQDEGTSATPFELSGGALCLDFANTWGNHADPTSDRLLRYEHLVAFAHQTGCLLAGTTGGLLREAAGDPEAAAEALRAARELREVVYRVFSNRAACREIPDGDVGRINAVLGETLSRRRLERRDGGFDWGWIADDPTDLRSPLWPVIESAASLLTSEDVGRVRECNADDCNWLFLDRSRGGTRRWCSMQSCGNRAKARRHYHRRKQS